MTTSDRQSFYERRAPFRPKELERAYHRLLKNCYVFLVPPEMRVLELGCGLGDLLAAVKPRRGVGVDFSPAMIQLAKTRHPELTFEVADAAAFRSDEKFDYILLSDLVNDLPDVQALFERLHTHSFQHTRLVLNSFTNLWRPALGLAEKLGFKSPTLPQNWLSLDDIKNLLYLAGWEIIKTDRRILWPVRAPLLGWFLNRWLAPIFKRFCLTVLVVARPRPLPNTYSHYTCSVIIPARDEARNIEAAVLRTPDMGDGTEIIIIEGHSRDATWNEMQRVAAKYPERQIKVLKQTSAGKGGALREAFAQATGDLLFILDADLTVPPEDLVRFYDVARSGIADLVNGVRLVYPVENHATGFLAMAANKLSSLAFTRLLGQPIKDTLCGTKVLFRTDYELIAANRAYFGDFDPVGDFDLLFGAAKLNLRIVDLPIRCQARAYGRANTSRWKHGWLLLRMACFAARRLKFFP